jgi:ribosomal protein L7/L12
MIKLEVNHADALTMLRSGKLTDEVRGNLQALILSAMDTAATVAKPTEDIVRLCMNGLGKHDHKIPVIKLVRQAVSDSHPGYTLGLKEAKDFVEGNDYTPITMPRSYADRLIQETMRYGYFIGHYRTNTRGSYRHD